MLTALQDLAKAFVKVLANEKAIKQIYNISGSKYVTFDGLARACAKVIFNEVQKIYWFFYMNPCSVIL